MNENEHHIHSWLIHTFIYYIVDTALSIDKHIYNVFHTQKVLVIACSRANKKPSKH